MRRPTHILHIFLLLPLLIIGCEEKNSADIQIKVLKEFKLSEETQEHVHRMYPTVVDNPHADEIALSNYVSPKNIVLINHEGEFIDVIGREGRGPGELLTTTSFGFDYRQNLVVIDKANSSFKYFNRKTNTINSYEYPIKKGLRVTSTELQSCNRNWYMGTQFLGKPTDTDTPIVAVIDSTFTVIDSLGGYDPFFKGRNGIFIEPIIKVDCEEQKIFTTHRKTPFVQVFSIPQNKLLTRTETIPASFMLSDKFITMVTNRREMINFTSDEQSTTLKIEFNEDYVFHIFRNNNKNYATPKILNESDHFAAIYDRESLNYIGEIELPGAVLGATKTGSLIILKDEMNMIFQFVDIIVGDTKQ